MSRVGHDLKHPARKTTRSRQPATRFVRSMEQQVEERLETVAEHVRSPRPVEIDAVFGGSLFCDLVFVDAPIPGPGEEVYAAGFALTVGGTANRCVAASRLGMSTGLIAVLGTDPLSAYVRSFLEAESGVRLDWLHTKPETIVPVTVALTNETDRSFITYEESGTRMPQTLTQPLPAVGSCDVALSEAAAPWVVALRAAGTRVYGGVGWDSTGRWDRATLDLLDHVDVFIPNEIEAMSYTRTDSALDAAKALAERVPLVVVTKGREGAIAIDSATGSYARSSAPIVTTVDPTGAGDVFTAGLMASAALGWDLTTQLQFACLGASLSVRSLGGAASAPRPNDIENFLTRTEPDGDWALIRNWAREKVTA